MSDNSVDETSQSDAVVQKSVTGSAYSIGSSAITIVVGFVRSVLLARLLLPEHFGVFALALFFSELLARPRRFGFDDALVHRDARGEDMASHFALQTGTALFSLIIALGIVPLLRRLYPDQPLLAVVMVALVGLEIIKAVSSTPEVVLVKRLEFKRIAVLDVGSSVSALLIAGLLAWNGAGVWSLVGERASGIIFRFLGLWAYRRPWNITLKTNWNTIKWFLRFGWYNFLTANMNFLLDRFDDFWTGTFLGSTPLGFYSKAYEFAGYPRRVVGNPIISVFFPVFARLQYDRRRLSKAFFRVASLIVRTGFLFAGTLALVTPDFIHVLIGDKWLPMALTFQLMLVYTLLDPLQALTGRLITALGNPQSVTQAKLVQLLVFVPAVVVLAHFFGINGVAVAADLMLFLGLVMLLVRAKEYVDYSLWRMVGYPTVALSLALASGTIVHTMANVQRPVASLLLKAATTAIVYGAVLFLFERKQLLDAFRLVYGVLTKQR